MCVLRADGSHHEHDIHTHTHITTRWYQLFNNTINVIISQPGVTLVILPIYMGGGGKCANLCAEGHDSYMRGV
jgi:hypothetical protein